MLKVRIVKKSLLDESGNKTIYSAGDSVQTDKAQTGQKEEGLDRGEKCQQFMSLGLVMSPNKAQG